jgi:hypothetical protein
LPRAELLTSSDSSTNRLRREIRILTVVPRPAHFGPPAERNDRTIPAAVYVALKPGTSVSADHAVTKAQALLKILEIVSI